MASIRVVQDIPLSKLVVSKDQVRILKVESEIAELADSIRVVGLLEPIIVCESECGTVFEILSGQRRFLAVKSLGRDTILAAILDERVDSNTARTISLTENLMRRDISQRERIDACTSLYRKYGTIRGVSEATGLPPQEVRRYIKYDRLIPELKAVVDSGEVDVKMALKAQDSVGPTEKTDRTDIVMVARALNRMNGHQLRTFIKQRVDHPEVPVTRLIESAKRHAPSVQTLASLSSEVHRALRLFAKELRYTQDQAAAIIIEEGLRTKGFLKAQQNRSS